MIRDGSHEDERVSAAPHLSTVRERASRMRLGLGAHPASSAALIAILVILTVAALRFASVLLVPIAIALLLSVLFAAPVRWLQRIGVPPSIGAAVIVFGAVSVLGAGTALLAKPASDWLRAAPSQLPDVEAKIRKLVRPLNAIERTAQQVQRAATPTGDTPQVTVEAPGIMTRVSGSTANAIAIFVMVLFLTYFFSSTGELLKRKLAGLVPDRYAHGRHLAVLAEIERQMAHYLWITTLISMGVGIATWGILEIAGLPNAVLWGVIAALMNYIPYVGTIVSAALIGAAALLTFDGIERTVLVLLGYGVIHTISGYVATPILLGRRLPLNQVALFLGLVFWTWVWGWTGALLAVPLTVMIKVVCDHIPQFTPVAELLDN